MPDVGRSAMEIGGMELEMVRPSASATKGSTSSGRGPNTDAAGDSSRNDGAGRAAEWIGTTSGGTAVEGSRLASDTNTSRAPSELVGEPLPVGMSYTVRLFSTLHQYRLRLIALFSRNSGISWPSTGQMVPRSYDFDSDNLSFRRPGEGHQDQRSRTGLPDSRGAPRLEAETRPAAPSGALR